MSDETFGTIIKRDYDWSQETDMGAFPQRAYERVRQNLFACVPEILAVVQVYEDHHECLDRNECRECQAHEALDTRARRLLRGPF